MDNSCSRKGLRKAQDAAKIIAWTQKTDEDFTMIERLKYYAVPGAYTKPVISIILIAEKIVVKVVNY